MYKSLINHFLVPVPSVFTVAEFKLSGKESIHDICKTFPFFCTSSICLKSLKYIEKK